MTEKIGLVTVLFNSTDVLPGFFKSLSGQDFENYYLYIIDNSLDDLSYKSSVALIEQYGMKNVMLIKNSENVGVAKGNNQGIQLALENACEYVLLLNNDIEFDDPGLFGKMLDVSKENDEKLVVPKIYFFDSGNIWCAGGDINDWTGTTTHRGEGETDKGQYDMDVRTKYAPTCFMLIHQSVFEKIGMMDEKYFVYYDDTDFVWRANHAGFGIYYWAAGEVKHKVSSSTGGSASPFTTYYAQRNRLYFIRKNFGFSMKVISLTYYFLTRLLKWNLFSKNLRKPFFSAVKDGLKM